MSNVEKDLRAAMLASTVAEIKKYAESMDITLTAKRKKDMVDEILGLVQARNDESPVRAISAKAAGRSVKITQDMHDIFVVVYDGEAVIEQHKMPSREMAEKLKWKLICGAD